MNINVSIKKLHDDQLTKKLNSTLSWSGDSLVNFENECNINSIFLLSWTLGNCFYPYTSTFLFRVLVQYSLIALYFIKIYHMAVVTRIFLFRLGFRDLSKIQSFVFFT